ncbi:hypothetical protein SLEP1_g11939 [Rubroshorea leprosula]|nr:hypothetical protein SLEP1_g11939 [Rubroshorea leprosula]
MIQELLGGAGLTVGERKIPINGSILEGTPTTTTVSPSPSTSSSSASATANSTTSLNSENQNLRCPRCDSSNTKFCYYNNYNLTQPRHFCKTCRRYWTKGGALRNVPIGGGCRKNKNSTSVSMGKSTAANKMKTVASEIGVRSGFVNGSDHDPLLWASPQNSHILALLRATAQNPNPNPVKEELGFMGSHGMNEPFITGAPNARALGSAPLGQLPSMGLCSSFWKNNQQNGIMLGEVQNTGIQELYQRLKSSSTNYYTDNSAVIFPGNVASSSSFSSSILESAPVAAGGELGYWNPVFSSWSDLPTNNGAYP